MSRSRDEKKPAALDLPDPSGEQIEKLEERLAEESARRQYLKERIQGSCECIGRPGQVRQKPFRSRREAESALERQRRLKERKGYVRPLRAREGS